MKQLVIPDRHLRFLLGHAHGAEPHEAVGLLGLVKLDAGELERMSTLRLALDAFDELDPWTTQTLYPGDNIAEEPEHNYLLNPKDQYAFEQEAGRRGEEWGIYHSHPHSDAAPSSSDVEKSEPHPGRLFLILGLVPGPGGQVVIRKGFPAELCAYVAGEEGLARLPVLIAA